MACFMNHVLYYVIDWVGSVAIFLISVKLYK